MTEGYSLEKWRNAPEQTLTPEEEAFVEEQSAKLAEIIDRLESQPNAPVRAVFKEIFRPDVWKVLINRNKTMGLMAKAFESKDGQMALAHAEAESWNEEYDRKAAAVRDSVMDFLDFVEKANGRVEMNDDTIEQEAPSEELEAPIVKIRYEGSATPDLPPFPENRMGLRRGTFLRAEKDMPFSGLKKGARIPIGFDGQFIRCDALTWDINTLTEEIDSGIWAVDGEMDLSDPVASRQFATTIEHLG